MIAKVILVGLLLTTLSEAIPITDKEAITEVIEKNLEFWMKISNNSILNILLQNQIANGPEKTQVNLTQNAPANDNVSLIFHF